MQSHTGYTADNNAPSNLELFISQQLIAKPNAMQFPWATAADQHQQQYLPPATNAIPAKATIPVRKFEQLEQEYQFWKNPSTERILVIAEYLNIPPSKVNRWFQNRRSRSKTRAKREKLQTAPSSPHSRHRKRLLKPQQQPKSPPCPQALIETGYFPEPVSEYEIPWQTCSPPFSSWSSNHSEISSVADSEPFCLPAGYNENPQGFPLEKSNLSTIPTSTSSSCFSATSGSSSCSYSSDAPTSPTPLSFSIEFDFLIKYLLDSSGSEGYY